MFIESEKSYDDLHDCGIQTEEIFQIEYARNLQRMKKEQEEMTKF